jgi:hypothetical protein
MPDFGDIPNLEELNLKGCIEIVQMDPSIGVLKKLYFLKLKDCKNLVSIPNNIFGLTSLKYLDLSGCPKVSKNPIQRQLKNLDSSESSSDSRLTTSSLKWTTIGLRSFYDYQKVLASSLLPSFLSLYCLSEVDISFCGLSQLPDAIGSLSQLERLNIGGNNFVTLPSLKELSNLEYLNLEHCKLLESLPHLPFPTFFDHMTKYKTTLKHMKKYYKRKIGLVIFNCPKLGETECYSRMAFSWMTRFIQARQQSSSASFDHDIFIEIVIPGSEIPIWFNNQSEGDSIRIDLSTIMDDNHNNCIGIACCVVFSIAPSDLATPTFPWGDRLRLQFYNSRIDDFSWNDIIPVILESDLIMVKSYHMCLMYIPMESFFDIMKWIDSTLTHLDYYKMQAGIDEQDKDLDFEVQNCGYRLVYEHDLPEFNLTMMHPGNPLAQKRKFLAIEDEEAQLPSFRGGYMCRFFRC